VHARGLIHKDSAGKYPGGCGKRGVWLTGFGIASRLPRERANPRAPDEIAGTLAYMAPEQTGRMTVSIDYAQRSVSLGVTYLRERTGMRPFAQPDPAEWVHCHIARQPVPPDQKAVELQGAVRIVMKLPPRPRERYQTAGCRGRFSPVSRGMGVARPHRPVPLGTRDASDRLLIPERLYGREREIETLLDRFNRVVAHATPELVLVSAIPHRASPRVVTSCTSAGSIARALRSGKFDQYKRDIPYATLAQSSRA